MKYKSIIDIVVGVLLAALCAVSSFLFRDQSLVYLMVFLAFTKIVSSHVNVLMLQRRVAALEQAAK
jgi:uncharacterized membrane protein YgaE (UPF0421/DUF939 family)